MFTTLCFSNDFSDFEGFLMPSRKLHLAKVYIYLKIDSNSVWTSTLIFGVQMKMIMLIQHAEKKENSSSKWYEMSKCSFGDSILVTEWNTVHSATLHFISIEIPDDA